MKCSTLLCLVLLALTQYTWGSPITGGDENTCTCALSWDPYCGSDGKTYVNECNFTCAQRFKPSIKLAHKGKCSGRRRRQVEQKKNACVCDKNIKPVCGSDDHTYSNECLLRCKQTTMPNLQKVRRGPCGNHVDVMDNNDQVQVVGGGQYRPGCGPCTRDLKPVCGSDGKTYSNECVMRCTASDPLVTVARFGRC